MTLKGVDITEFRVYKVGPTRRHPIARPRKCRGYIKRTLDPSGIKREGGCLHGRGKGEGMVGR